MLPMVLSIALFGCKPPPDLIDETTDDVSDTDASLDEASLADVLPLLYRDAEQPLARVQELVEVLERELGDQGVDVANEDRAKREFTLTHLPNDMLGEVVPPEGADPEAQVSVVVFGRSTHGRAGAIEVQLLPNQVCIESNTTVYYRRVFSTDTDCFEAGTCEWVRSVAEVRKELSILESGWYDFHKDFRRFELADGREVLLARGWIPEVYPLEKGGFAYQTYSLEVWLERDGALDRTYALWGQLDIGLGDDAMLDLTADALHENMERQDAWVSDTPVEEYCGNDRDRAYDRPAP